VSAAKIDAEIPAERLASLGELDRQFPRNCCHLGYRLYSHMLLTNYPKPALVLLNKAKFCCFYLLLLEGERLFGTVTVVVYKNAVKYRSTFGVSRVVNEVCVLLGFYVS
jgi:hypothetical protein